MEGVNVSLANFHDSIIDYPNSKDYAFKMFEKLLANGLLDQQKIELYKQHIENMMDEDFQY